MRTNFSIRSAASAVLRRFIDVTSHRASAELRTEVLSVLLPGLKEVLTVKSEAVRNEALLTISHAVDACRDIPVLTEMLPLITDNEETNYFLGITHIQVHRRARALRRFREIMDTHAMSEKTLFGIHLPIFEHIISGSTEVSDHHLVNEAINTVGHVAKRSRWSKYYGLLVRYIRLAGISGGQQKVCIRTISSIIDGFPAFEQPMVDPHGLGIAEDGKDDNSNLIGAHHNHSVNVAITTKLLPSLSRFQDVRHESDVSVRIPMALSAVKLSLQLPSDRSDVEIQRIITTLAQALRSKDQDTRDIVRDTMCRIAILLPPAWMQRVIRELKAALQRGPQKHVAAVTVHAVLSRAVSESADTSTNIDEAIEDVTEIGAEVIWGHSGREVLEDGFRSKTREVKSASSRAMDTLQLLARLVSPERLISLIAPVREILRVTQAVQPLLQADEALRRISLGLNSNDRLSTGDVLQLCYNMAGASDSLSSGGTAKKRSLSTVDDAHRVRMKRDEAGEQNFFSTNSHKLVAFGLNLLVVAYRRGQVDFEDDDILARIGPLVPLIGDSLRSRSNDVLEVGLKAAATLSKCPSRTAQDALPLFAKSIFLILQSGGGGGQGAADIIQAAFKALAVLLRDCKKGILSISQIRELLDIIKPDLEEHDRQAAVFAVLRALVSKGYEMPELYDFMDQVSAIMVTSHSIRLQELARATLLSFLLDFPQGNGRLKTQMTFLAKNLAYEHESGRISVMEILAVVIKKSSDELVDQYADVFFVALVAVLANDDSEKCRKMSTILVQDLFARLGHDHQALLLSVLTNWIRVKDTDSLCGPAINVLGLLCHSKDTFTRLIRPAVPLVNAVIAATVATLEESQQSITQTSLDNLHEIVYHSLRTVMKAVEWDREIASSIPVDAVIKCLITANDWVRFDAATLLTSLINSPALDVIDRVRQFEIARRCCLILSSMFASQDEFRERDANLIDKLIELLFHLAKLWKVCISPLVCAEAVLTSLQQEPASELLVEAAEGLQQNMDHDEESSRRPLVWLMSRMSFIARQIILQRPLAGQDTVRRGNHTSGGDADSLQSAWSQSVISILTFFSGVFGDLSKASSKRFLLHVIAPLYRILEDNGPATNSQKDDRIGKFTISPVCPFTETTSCSRGAKVCY